MLKSTHVRRCLLLLPFLALVTIGAAGAEDGWRRTAHGWEKVHVTRASVAFGQPEVVAKSDPIHPGQLGILQVAGSCLVLGLFASRATIVRTGR